MTITTKPEPNPYLLACPDCTAVLCSVCAQWDRDMAVLCDCHECDKRRVRIGQKRKMHLARYEHTGRV